MPEKTQMTLYPTAELKQRLEVIAALEHRTVNAQGCLLLERAIDQYENPPMRIAVRGEHHVDMLSESEVDPVTLEPVRMKNKKGRTTTCEHRLGPDQFCGVCDA